jgi:hypothetical protein
MSAASVRNFPAQFVTVSTILTTKRAFVVVVVVVKKLQDG